MVFIVEFVSYNKLGLAINSRLGYMEMIRMKIVNICSTFLSVNNKQNQGNFWCLRISNSVILMAVAKSAMGSSRLFILQGQSHTYPSLNYADPLSLKEWMRSMQYEWEELMWHRKAIHWIVKGLWLPIHSLAEGNARACVLQDLVLRLCLFPLKWLHYQVLMQSWFI